MAMSLATPESVQRLQAALHAKAKGEPGYRFYCVHDKVYRRDVLAHAYACCRAKGGAAGVDGETFAAIESCGPDRWLGELAEARRRLRQWLRAKYPHQGYGRVRYSDTYLHEVLGLVRLQERPRGFPWAKA